MIKFICFNFRAMALVTLSKEAIDTLIDLSGSHQDHYLQSLGKEGGYLYQWSRTSLAPLYYHADLEIQLDISKLEDLIKLCKFGTTEEINGLEAQFIEILSNLHKAAADVNKK